MNEQNIECPICGSKNFSPINSFCIFMKKEIYRYKCADCDLIFGPIEYINFSKDQLIEKYKELYKTYSEGDTTQYEVKTFLSMNPKKDGLYLNYGSGIWSKSKKIITDMGYYIECYDFSFDNLSVINNVEYDGIMSHNLIEHLQNPIESFNMFNNLLKIDGIMSHSTACFKYEIEYSIFHLYFLIGKSIELLSNKTGFEIEHFSEEPGYIIKKFIKK
jgi:DNA-directed RNA polymerase subunit RPC12/RpoP